MKIKNSIFTILTLILYLPIIINANNPIIEQVNSGNKVLTVNPIIPAILQSDYDINNSSIGIKQGKDILLKDDLPEDFPAISINVLNNPSPGYTFLNSISFQGKTVNYNIILDSAGEVFYYNKPLIGGVDFKMQPNGLFSYGRPIKMGDEYQAGPVKVQNVMVVEEILDSAFNLIDNVQMKNGYLADIHDFQILPNGNYMLIAYEKNPIDMSKVVEGGNPNANVIGTVIQELDINKNCVFQWRSLDFIPITDTKDNVLNATFEHVHGNSVFLDTDGNLIVSFPTSFEIVKLDMISGQVLWRFGGDNNQFEITGENEANHPYYFSMQHDAKKLANGNLIFYDNGVGKSPWYSRGVEYEFDEYNKIANMVWEYRHKPDISAFAMGSIQRLNNGSTLIDWGLIFLGFYRTLTEVNTDKETTFEMSFPSDAYSYRGFKYELPACQPVANVDIYEILEGNTYSYKNKNENTGLDIYFETIQPYWYNYTNVKKIECAPLYPKFHKEAPVLIPYRYLFKAQMIDSFTGEIRFDVTQLNWIENPIILKVYYRSTPNDGYFEELESWFDETELKVVAKTSGFGEYVIGYDRTSTEIFPPGNMRPFNNSIIVNNHPVTIVWSSTGRYDYFQLQIAEDQDFENIIIDTIDVTTPIITYNGLESEKTYYWRTKTFYRDLESNWSEIWRFSFTEPFIDIEFPDGGESLAKDSAAYILRWNTNITDSVSISLLKNGEKYLMIKDSLLSYTNAFAWKIPKTVPDDSDYEIQVRSIKDNTLIAESDDYFTIRSKYTSVDDGLSLNKSKVTNLSIAPNPSSSNTNISFKLNEATKVNLIITDQLGNVIKTFINTYLSEGMYNFDLNTINLSSGVYYCMIRNNDEVIVEKIIVMR